MKGPVIKKGPAGFAWPGHELVGRMGMRTTGKGITAGTLVPDLLRDRPQVRPVLDRYGLRGCGGLGGPVETLEFFAKAHEVPLDRLLAELETAAQEEPSPAEP